MQAEPADVVNPSAFKNMAKIILHDPPLLHQEIENRRLNETLLLSHQERFRKAMMLMRLGAMFSKDGFRKPQGLGVVLKSKKQA